MALAIIIAAMIQLGIISTEAEYSDTLYQQNQNSVEIIIDDLEIN